MKLDKTKKYHHTCAGGKAFAKMRLMGRHDHAMKAVVRPDGSQTSSEAAFLITLVPVIEDNSDVQIVWQTTN